jgi:hypothetical protein
MAKDASNTAESSEKTPFMFPSGYVTLLATHPKTKQPLTGTVLSHALILASPIWKNFLFPPWETNDVEPKPKQIDCKEDDSSALLILLNIAHLQFNEVPNGKLEYSLLFEVAKLCDQYNCVDLVRPWLQAWLAGEQSECLMVGQEGWVWIAWVFGREKGFEACAKNLAKVVSTDKKCACLLENGKLIPEPVPPGIVGKFGRQMKERMTSSKARPTDSILKVRQAHITKTLKVLYELAESYRDCLFRNGSKCRASSNAEACNDVIYGSILRNLQQARLWPIKSAESIFISPEALVEKLRKMNFQTMPITPHRYCSPSLHCLYSVMSSTETPVLAAHRGAYEIQNREEK